MSYVFLGIDPGFTGACATLEIADSGTSLVEVIDVPITGSGAKQSVDVILLQEWIQRHGPRHAFLERAQAMPRQGSSSGFKYGRCTGALEATLLLCAVPLVIVEPSRWKRHFHLHGTDKEGARQLAIRMFPREHRFFARRKDHNRAEAVLIGVYGGQSVLHAKPVVEIPILAEAQST
jgi:crossover junction endodeoxyribonuclease RuvC